MPIAHKYKCVFIHIPRTGGTSVEKLLGVHRDWPDVDLEVFHGQFDQKEDYLQLQHLSYPEMCAIRDISQTHDYFKFTIVRNPWGRLVSEYYWQKLQESISFENFVSRAVNIVNSRSKITGAYCHFRPQIEFLSADLDRVLRFENYTNEVKEMLLEIEIEAHEIPHFGGTSHMDYTEYYNEKTIASVADIYRQDIQLFGYEFGS